MPLHIYHQIPAFYSLEAELTMSVLKIFKIVLSKAFDLKCTIPEIENVGDPLLLYQSC